MKKQSWIQLGIGLVPIVLGFCCSLLPLPLFLTNLLFFVLWAWLCFRFSDISLPLLPQLLRICLPGALVLGPALWADLAMVSLPSLLSIATQFYFISGITMAGRILTPLLRIITAWPYYIVSYLCMSIVCLIAMILKRKIA